MLQYQPQGDREIELEGDVDIRGLGLVQDNCLIV
jgi:hypothetical protein